MALVYGASPIDLIPDFIPIAGWLDDLGIGGSLVVFGLITLMRHAKKQRQYEQAISTTARPQ
jgi:uncharacterized membrane protein YkvA (DUF1232 family)